MEVRKDQYNKYVKKVTPVHSTVRNAFLAFLGGGLLCTLGAFISGYLKYRGADEEEAGIWTLLIFIFLSALLTGLNIFQKLARVFGAGVLVPITGFANSVASPALEYKAEGQVFGIGCKIFTIAGPVILYGVLASCMLGFLYWAGNAAGL